MRNNRVWIAAALLIAVHFALALHGAMRHSAVVDEIVYPTSGYSYLTTGDYRMNPEHPPFLKLWTGVSWLGFGIDVEKLPGWSEGNEWVFGQRMIYGEGMPYLSLLVRARGMNALLSAMLALAVFFVARRLGGGVAGLVALALYAFDPLAIAHAGIAVTDLGGAAFYFAAALLIPGAVLRGGKPRIVGVGATLGLALASKFTNVLLLATLAGAVVLGVARSRRKGRRAVSPRLAVLRAVVVAAIALAVVTATYGPAGPGSYFSGLGMVISHVSTGHESFAFGRHSDMGWWWYFPAAWLVKTPIPILLATGAGLAVAVLRFRQRPVMVAVLVAAPALVFAAAMKGRLDIGVRHVMTLTPFAAVAGGWAAAEAARRSRAARAVIVALLLWLAVGTLRVHPDEIAYANEMFGGPENLWRHLVDSNVDWGQALPALAEEVGRHPLRRLYLGYFGTSDPHAYGLRYVWLPSGGVIPHRYEDGPDPDGKEWVALSVSNLQDLFSVPPNAWEWLRDRPFAAFPGYSIALFDITGDAAAHRKIAQVAMRFDEAKSAEPPLRRVIELDPGDGQARLDLARVLAHESRFEEAEISCTEAERLLPPATTQELCSAIRENLAAARR